MSWIDHTKLYDNETHKATLKRAASQGVVFSCKKFIESPSTEGPLDPTLSVSVIMTNFRRTCYLPYALGSLKSQFEPLPNPRELIFVDDNSGDDCDDVIREFAAESGWPTTFCQTGKNITWNESLSANIGVKHASHELLVLNDADTVLLGKSVENILRVHSSIPNLWLTPVARDLGEYKLDLEHILDQGYVMERPIGPCIMRYQGSSVRRRFWNECGGFNEDHLGWASIDDELFNELNRTGVVFSQVLEVNVEDFPGPPEAQVPEARSGQGKRPDRVSKGERGRLPETGHVWRMNYD